MPDFVDTTVQGLDRRLDELQEEQRRLQAARAALVDSTASSTRRGRRATTTRATATTDSQAGASPATQTTRRGPGRPRGRQSRNTRGKQALTVIRQTPGLTIPQLAERLKIQPNYLYRVIPNLVSDGLVSKDGQTLHPAGE